MSISPTAQRVTSTPNDGLGVQQSLYVDSGVGEGGSEVVSHYDGRLYVTNGENDAIDIINLDTGIIEASLDLTLIPGYGGLNSVDVSAGGIAVAIENDDADADGFIAIYALDATSASTPAQVITAGNLPDMVTFSKDGTQIFVANEGEPTDDGDPQGSLTIIDVASGTSSNFDFSAFDAQVDDLRDAGVRIFPGELPSTDFEPEYIAEGPDGKLYISLQEANAIAVFDPAQNAITTIIPLGTVDHSLPGFGIDASDRDDAIDISTVPVVGMRMPDAIAVTEIAGTTYILTANEGDARDEDVRIEDVTLDPTLFPNAGELQTDEELGRLQISEIDGDIDGDGDIDVLHAYGSRSFTIFDTDGNVVFDSGDDFETLIAELRVDNAFNNDDFPSDDPDVIDENRSDNKGPEPEAIAVGTVDGKTLAFIGLERDSGIMIYDISDPANSVFVDYIDSSTFGHISPEIIEFIPADGSTSGLAQIAVSYEVSGTTAVYDLAFGSDYFGDLNGNTIAASLGDDVVFARSGNDLVFGQGGDDELRGGRGKDELNGGVGNDKLIGGVGRDRLDGGLGDDRVLGGSGNDTLDGGTGDDTLFGGAGPDVFVYRKGDGNDIVRDFADGDTLVLTGVREEDVTLTQVNNRRVDVTIEGSDDVLLVRSLDASGTLDIDDIVFA